MNNALIHGPVICHALQRHRTAALGVCAASAATLGAIESLMHAYHASMTLFSAKSQSVVGVLSASQKDRERLL